MVNAHEMVGFRFHICSIQLMLYPIVLADVWMECVCVGTLWASVRAQYNLILELTQGDCTRATFTYESNRMSLHLCIERHLVLSDTLKTLRNEYSSTFNFTIRTYRSTGERSVRVLKRNCNSPSKPTVWITEFYLLRSNDLMRYSKHIDIRGHVLCTTLLCWMDSWKVMDVCCLMKT